MFSSQRSKLSLGPRAKKQSTISSFFADSKPSTSNDAVPPKVDDDDDEDDDELAFMGCKPITSNTVSKLSSKYRYYRG
jgi:hypothetical protein